MPANGWHESSSSWSCSLLLCQQLHRCNRYTQRGWRFCQEMRALRLCPQHMVIPSSNAPRKTLPRELWIQQWIRIRFLRYIKLDSPLHVSHWEAQCQAFHTELEDPMGTFRDQRLGWQSKSYPSPSGTRCSSIWWRDYHDLGRIWRKILPGESFTELWIRCRLEDLMLTPNHCLPICSPNIERWGGVGSLHCRLDHLQAFQIQRWEVVYHNQP